MPKLNPTPEQSLSSKPDPTLPGRMSAVRISPWVHRGNEIEAGAEATAKLRARIRQHAMPAQTESFLAYSDFYNNPNGDRNDRTLPIPLGPSLR